jgi:hypothetical protein
LRGGGAAMMDDAQKAAIERLLAQHTPPGTDPEAAKAAIESLFAQRVPGGASNPQAAKTAFAAFRAQQATKRPALRRAVHSVIFLLLAAAAFVAYEHFKLHGQSTQAMVSLLLAGIFALWPLRILLRGFGAVEGTAMHLVHGVGGLAFAGLAFGGVISGKALLTHAALAPFAIMGAAQALMHSDHPRNAEQAAALRSFATSLPEVQQFASAKDLTSPANAARAVTVLSDLIKKAQVLGETELKSDPGFQSALAQATTRFGLTLSLDTIEHAIQNLATNPETAQAVPGLQNQLAAARKIVAKDKGM